MPAERMEIYVYTCARCQAKVQVTSPYRDDAPEGYYFSVRRVTEYKNHKVTPEVYVCSKECLVEFMRWQITHNSVPIEPIGRKKRG